MDFKKVSESVIRKYRATKSTRTFAQNDTSEAQSIDRLVKHSEVLVIKETERFKPTPKLTRFESQSHQLDELSRSLEKMSLRDGNVTALTLKLMDIIDKNNRAVNVNNMRGARDENRPQRDQGPRNGLELSGQRNSNREGYGRSRDPTDPMRCFYCGVNGHMKTECKELEFDRSKGLCHLDDRHMICAGKEGTGVEPIRMRNGAPQQTSVREEYERNTGKSAPRLTNTSSSKSYVNPIRVEYDVSDDEETAVSDIDSDEWRSAADAHVAAARREDQKKPTEPGRFKNDMKVLRARREREEKMAKPSVMREVSNYWDTLGLDPSARRTGSASAPMELDPEATQEEAPKKPSKKTGPVPRSDRYQREAAVKEVQDKILEASVTLSFKNLMTLGLNPPQRLLFGNMRLGGAIETRPDVGEAVVNSIVMKPERICECPKLPVTLRGLSKAQVNSLLDSGAQISVMTRELQEKAGLPMKLLTRESMGIVSYNSDKLWAVGICLNVAVRIGSVTVLQHIFVVEKGDHKLILGQPFFKQGKVGVFWNNGRQYVDITGENGRTVNVPLHSAARYVAPTVEAYDSDGSETPSDSENE